jgi:dTDP-4-amino-4,6-dideoxygalactose transaminase
LDTIQAAVLKVKLNYLDEWNLRRKRIAEMYSRYLENVGDLILPFIQNNNESSYHLYVVRSKKRDKLHRYLNSRGIQTLIHYPVPIHLQDAYTELRLGRGAFPVAEMLSAEILSLPIHPYLSDEEVNYVITCLKDFFD